MGQHMVKTEKKLQMKLNKTLEHLKKQTWSGKVIEEHRALRVLRFSKSDLFFLAAIPLSSNALLWFFWEKIALFWMGASYFFLNPVIDGLKFGLLELIGTDLYLYVPLIKAHTPSPYEWWFAFAWAFVLIAATQLPSKRLLPVRYLCGLLGGVQLSAQLYFTMFESIAGINSLDYLTDVMTASCYWIWLTPWLLTLTFNVFPFSLAHKMRLTALCVCYLIFSFPVQYAFQAFVLNEFSSIWVPMMFFIASLPLNILAVICFYSMGMAWPMPEEALRSN